MISKARQSLFLPLLMLAGNFLEARFLPEMGINRGFESQLNTRPKYAIGILGIK
jgi:hypothetical protein